MSATLQLVNPIGSVYQPRRTSLLEVVISSASSEEIAASAFAKLSRCLVTSVFDLRRTDFQEFTESFQRLKNQIEGILNGCPFDRAKLSAEFNRLAAHALRSADNFKLDVMAKINRQGQIELLFMEH